VHPTVVTNVDPAIRYHLVRIVLDHTYSTLGPTVPGESCGGFAEPMCFYLTRAEWVTMDIVERNFLVNQEYLTMNDPNFFACFSGTVPARAATWGTIKAQYRD
jgi:hypothetical protein